MRIKDISKENRPRERFQKYSASGLNDAELLAIILQSGSSGENVIDISHRLISKYGLDKLSGLSLMRAKNSLCSWHREFHKIKLNIIRI